MTAPLTPADAARLLALRDRLIADRKRRCSRPEPCNLCTAARGAIEESFEVVALALAEAMGVGEAMKAHPGERGPVDIGLPRRQPEDAALVERTRTLLREREAATKAISDLGEMIGHLVWMLETNNAPGWEGDCPVCIQAKSFIREAPAATGPGTPLAQRHTEHYRSCNCLGDSAECCVDGCECHDA